MESYRSALQLCKKQIAEIELLRNPLFIGCFVVNRDAVIDTLLPIPSSVIEKFYAMMPGIAKRLSESFYEDVESKEAILKKDPVSLKSCTEWLSVLSQVQNQAEKIRDRFSEIVEFYQLMDDFQINKNQKTADAAVIKGITDAFTSLIDTAEASKDYKATHVQNYTVVFERKVLDTNEKVRQRLF